MKARYAKLIADRINSIQTDNTGKIDNDTRYLNTVIYPFIAIAMYKGMVHTQITSSRLTEKVAEKLRAKGFVVRREDANDQSSLFTNIEWGDQRIWDDDGEESWVSSEDYNKWADKVKADHGLDVNSGVDNGKREDGERTGLMGWGFGE